MVTHKTQTIPIHLATQVFLLPNLAIAMAYLTIGITSSLKSIPLSLYLINILNAEPQIQTTLSILTHLPWSFKLIIGLMSDLYPICGMHRKPYLILGAVMYSFPFLMYSMINGDNVIILAMSLFISTIGMIFMDVIADTLCVERSRFEHEDIRGEMQSSYYTIRFLGNLIGAILGSLISNKDNWGWGLTFKQVLLVSGCIPLFLVCPFLLSLKEKYRKHPQSLSEGWGSYSNLPTEEKILIPDQYLSSPRTIYPYYGSMRPRILSTSGIDEVFDWKTQDEEFSGLEKEESSGISPRTRRKSFTIIPSEKGMYIELDGLETSSQHLSLKIQWEEIWKTVQLNSLWRPMIFVYFFNVFHIPNVAWKSYLLLTLHFQPWILGVLSIVGSLMTFLGILGYKWSLTKCSWKKLYLWSTFIKTLGSLSQLILIFQINTKYLSINNIFFSLGDDVVISYISGILFLPLCILSMKLCPKGAEGASYSLLTTFNNVAGICGQNVAMLIAEIWDVSNESLRQGNIEGLWKLQLTVSLASLLPLFLLHYLPKNENEQEEIATDGRRSKTGGALFLLVLVLSIIWIIATTIEKFYRF